MSVMVHGSVLESEAMIAELTPGNSTSTTCPSVPRSMYGILDRERFSKSHLLNCDPKPSDMYTTVCQIFILIPVYDIELISHSGLKSPEAVAMGYTQLVVCLSIYIVNLLIARSIMKQNWISRSHISSLYVFDDDVEIPQEDNMSTSSGITPNGVYYRVSDGGAVCFGPAILMNSLC